MSQHADIAQPASLDFGLFLRSYKHKIRPEGQLECVQAAFRLDAEFFAQFAIFQKIFRRSKINWGDEIVLNLQRKGALPKDISTDDMFRIISLYNKHTRLFRIGRFDEHYLDSIEDIALFFILHDVKSIWIAGAYRELSVQLIDLIMVEVGKAKDIPLAHSMKALSLALTVELNQIQRVFTMYERDVSESLVKDLSYGGMLTGMPTGRKT